MDPENVGKEAIIRVTDWLRSIWEMKKRDSGPVQQWIDSIPSPTKSTVNIHIERPDSPLSAPERSPTPKTQSMTVSTSISVPNSPAITMPTIPNRVKGERVYCSSCPHSKLARDPSFQSDSSRCSSVESLLEQRKADPEAILFGLGFGGCGKDLKENGSISRIPKRFLQPSKLKGIAIDDFMKQQQANSESYDSTSLGYRGLTGPPHVVPSKIVQKITERFRSHESHDSDICVPTSNSDLYNICTGLLDSGRVSVLSPDNRQFLARQRSKSPDMRNKRMIIGQKSFAFSRDGDLIEIQASKHRLSKSTSASTDSNKNLESSLQLKEVKEQQSVHKEMHVGRLRKKIVKQKPIDKLSSDSLSGSEPNSPLQNDTPELVSSRESSDTESPNNQTVAPAIKSPNTPDKQFSWSLDDCQAPVDSLEEPGNSSGVTACPNLHGKLGDNRRFSDGVVGSQVLRSKRGYLRRQARITDTEATLYCKNLLPEDKGTAQHDVREVEPLKDDVNDSESSNLSDKDDLDHVCEAQNEDCFHHNSRKTCWKKVQRIFEKNKKLESMVVKSRQEMAEIKEMLNSVMSVRLEPGF